MNGATPMKYLERAKMVGVLVPTILGILTLFGCASNAPLHETSRISAPQSKISFIDITKFDKDLAASLSSDIQTVDVSFYEKVSPNKIPERMQQWISAVESTGGKVKVETPPNEPQPRSVFALLSLLGSAYSALKNQLPQPASTAFKAAQGRNAVISLERGPSGGLVVEKIQFTK